jgi:DNA-3-methyladenine glycosylase II
MPPPAQPSREREAQDVVADRTRLGGPSAPSRDPWQSARRVLAGRDPRLALLTRLAHPVERVIPDPRPINHLAVRTIVSQLLSTAAAKTINERLLEAHGTIDGVIAWAMAAGEDDPPAHGLSRAKRKAIGVWGRFVAEEGDPRERWAGLPAAELLTQITALRGFGPWSADMLAIFGFGHPDVWPEGDVAVMRIARRLWPRRKPPSIRRLVAGHGSYAAICCWSVIGKGREGEL